MLVLSRKLGEKVVIDGRITITVVNCGGGRVKLGIEAPAEVGIFRNELPAAHFEEEATGLWEGLDNDCEWPTTTELIAPLGTKDPLRRLRRIPR